MEIKKRTNLTRQNQPLPDYRQLNITLIVFAFLLVTIFGLYSFGMHNDFSKSDDYDYIVSFGHFDRPLNLSGIKQIFVGVAHNEEIHDYYRPLYILIRTIDYHLWKIDPFGYRLTNILFYYFACCVLFLITRRLTNSDWTAAVAALIFAVHPAHVESVTWIMSGGYPMSFLFMCLSLYAFLKIEGGGKHKTIWTRSALAFYLAAGLTNPPAIILPALIVLYLYFFKKKETLSLPLSVPGGFAAIFAAIVILNYYIFPAPYTKGNYKDTFTALLTTIWNMAQYMYIMFIPLNLHTPNEHMVTKVLDPGFIISVIFIAVIFVAGLRLLLRRSLYGFGLLWFFICLMPSISVWKSTTTFCERYCLYSSAGFAIVAAVFFERLPSFFPSIPTDKAVRLRNLILLLVLVFYSCITIQRNFVWKNTETLFLDTLRKSPGNMYASMTLGTYYIVNDKKPEKAIPILLPAIDYHEKLLVNFSNKTLQYAEKVYVVELRNILGNAYRETGRVDEAIAEHKRAMELVPEFGKSYQYMAIDYDTISENAAKIHDTPKAHISGDEALKWYRECINHDPRNDGAYQNAAILLLERGVYSEAESMLKKTLSLSPYNFKALGILADVYIRTNRTESAIDLLHECLRQAKERGDYEVASHVTQTLNQLTRQASPSYAQNRQNAAAQAVPNSSDGADSDQQFASLFSEKRYEEALAVALAQEKLQRDNPRIANNIGLTYFRLKQIYKAEEYYKKSIQFDDSYALSHYNLAILFSVKGNIEQAIKQYNRVLELRPDMTEIHQRIFMLENAKKTGQNAK